MSKILSFTIDKPLGYEEAKLKYESEVPENLLKLQAAMENKKPEHKTVSGFLNWYFENHKPSTHYVSSGRQQTADGAHRTLGDLYLLCKHYYPKVKFDTVISYLYRHVQDGSLKTDICGTIKKRVFGNYTNADQDTRDEFEMTWIHYRKIHEQTQAKLLKNRPKPAPKKAPVKKAVKR